MEANQIDLLALPSLALTERAQLPDAAGIYFALVNTDVIYIGKARRLRMRWASNTHHRYSQFATMGNVRLAWLTLGDETLCDAVEQACIAYFNPRFNSTVIEDGSTRLVTFRIPADLHARLTIIANRSNRKPNPQIIMFLEAAVAADEQALAAREAAQRP